MHVDIYRSRLNSRIFVAVPVGVPLSTVPLEAAELAEVAAFRLCHPLHPDRASHGANAAEIARRIEETGYAILLGPRAEG